MIIKTYHIIINDITQIINSILNSNFYFFPFLSKYTNLAKKESKYAKVDPIKLDQSGLNLTKQTEVGPIRPKWTELNKMNRSGAK